VALETVACGEPGCTVNRVAEDVFEVQSDRAGTVHIDITARRVGNGAVLSDELVLTYSEVSRLDIYRPREQGHGATLPVVRGTRLFWCASAFGDGPEGVASMFIPPDLARFVVDGTVLGGASADTQYDSDIPSDGLIGCLNIQAIQAGTGTAVVQFSGQQRTISLDVVDPSAVVSVSVHDLFSSAELLRGLASVVKNISVDDPGMDPCSASAIRIGASLGAQHYAWEFGLNDGGRAVGAASSMKPLPGGSFSLAAEGRYSGLGSAGTATGLFSVDAWNPGTNTIEVSVGTSFFSVPVLVEPTSLLYSTCDG
jgi:hypothetical protein